MSGSPTDGTTARPDGAAIRVALGCMTTASGWSAAEVALAELDALLRERDEVRQALRDLLQSYEHADLHIREELQPEFERLGEQRLATWWHGCDPWVDRARAVLGSLTEGEQ